VAGQDGITEAEKCAELREKVLPPHSRDLAVAYLDGLEVYTLMS
jgi:hypothetical protein